MNTDYIHEEFSEMYSLQNRDNLKNIFIAKVTKYILTSKDLDEYVLYCKIR